jgi:DNA-binding cell septation regulator SpoVG
VDGYLWWEERTSIPNGKVRADLTVTYTDRLVTHAVAVSEGEPDIYTACHRLVPTGAALRNWSNSGAVCRVCRRKIREAQWG